MIRIQVMTTWKTFLYLVLDKPAPTVAGSSVDGEKKRIVSIQFIKIVNQEGLDQYLDRDINMTISPYDVGFPGDTFILLGKPYTTNVTFGVTGSRLAQGTIL